MNNGAFIAIMAAQNSARMAAERRRRDEEERRRRERRRKEEEERKRKEKEYRNMIENSPVQYTRDSWQIDRCLKGISLNDDVNELLRVVALEEDRLLEEDKKGFNRKLAQLSSNYSTIRQEIESLIEQIESSGIHITGSNYEYIKVKELDANMSDIKVESEYLGTHFKPSKETEIIIDSEVLNKPFYYSDTYAITCHEQVEKEYNELKSKVEFRKKYYGWYKPYINSEKFKKMQKDLFELSQKLEKAEIAKKKLDSYNSLSDTQLNLIKSYIDALQRLRIVSNDISKTNSMKEYKIRLYKYEHVSFNNALDNIVNQEEYRTLVSRVFDYISKVKQNDTETMNEIFDKLKGCYPISIVNKMLYETLLSYDLSNQFVRKLN